MEMEIVAVKWPDAPPKGDLADFVEQGGTLEQFRGFPNIDLEYVFIEKEAAKKTKKSKKIFSSITGFELTDLGNAERLVSAYGDDIAYVPQLGWLYYNGKKWEKDNDSLKLRDLAAITARNIRNEAVKEKDPEAFKRLANHAVRSESASRIGAMLQLAEPKCVKNLDIFDNNDFLLNVNNGTIDLRTGQLRPHRREDFLMRVSPVNYNPDATSSRFGDFLTEVFPDRETREMVHRIAGYCITGSTREEKFFIAWGSGANGKSKFWESISNTIGSDYAIKAPRGLFVQSRDKSAETMVSSLYGVRLAMDSETDEGRKLDEGLLKDLTGESIIKARFLYKERFDFRATHKLVLSTNHRPKISGTDNGIWRRLVLIPFSVTIPEEKRDPLLSEKLKADAEAILSWLVMGAQIWYNVGLKIPSCVSSVINEYKSEEDVIGQWIQEEICTSHAGKVSAKDLYTSFKNWTETRGERVISQKALGNRLTNRGYVKKLERAGYCYMGIELKGGPR